MIVRARPSVNMALLKAAIKGGVTEQESDLLFFDRGCSALKFFLSYYGKGKRVGVQTLTCPTVIETIKNTGNLPVFVDIDIDYYTTTIDYVRRIIDCIDVLILTHLFGIPNPDYVEIKKLCKDKSVVLIDDLCHTYHAKVGEIYMEELSENYFYSYYVDKPISGISGGALKTNLIDAPGFIESYKRLPKVDFKEGCGNLRRLYWIHTLLSPQLYKRDFRTNSRWEKYILSKYPLNAPITLLKLLIHPRISAIFTRLGFRDGKAEVRRMSDVERSYILSMSSDFYDNNKKAKDIFTKLNVQPLFMECENIRCSIAKRTLVRKDAVKDIDTVEVGLYNWEEPIVDDISKYPNTAYIISNYVNIPTYTTEWL